MLVDLAMPKLYPYKNIMLTLMACILVIGLGAYALQVEMSSKDTVKLCKKAVPMLLNSGIVQTKEAEVSVILWFENGDIPLEVRTKWLMSDWTWTFKEQQTGSGKVAATLFAHRRIDKNEETNLYTWYNTLAQSLAKMGGRIYLDERVSQVTDISAYLSQTNALPAQWILSGNLVSIAAYQNDLLTSVVAGQDRVNIQLLSRGENTKGQTVLAIPVLLEEF